MPEGKKYPYVLYWKDGHTEVVYGENINNAFTEAGYGFGAINAVDFYSNGTEPTHEWTGSKWIRIKHGWEEQ